MDDEAWDLVEAAESEALLKAGATSFKRSGRSAGRGRLLAPILEEAARMVAGRRPSFSYNPYNPKGFGDRGTVLDNWPRTPGAKEDKLAHRYFE